MRTVLVGARPIEVEDLIERRRALGQDLFDEVWAGDYHMTPVPHGRLGEVDYQLARILGPLADQAGLRGRGPCNIGKADDYRVPDQAYFDDPAPRLYHASAALVVEIASPGDESRPKFDFYFQVSVAEVVIVDPQTRTVEWYGRGEVGFHPASGSALLDISSAELATRITWPR